MPRSPCRASVGWRKTLLIPKLFMVATTFLPIFPLFPTPLTTIFPPQLTDLEITLTALLRPSWATLSVSYKSSRAVKASRSVLITCNTVDKAHVLLGSSSGVPTSDISVDEADDVGVRGLWNNVFEVILSTWLSKGMSSPWASVLSSQMTGFFYFIPKRRIVNVAYKLRSDKVSLKDGKVFGRQCKFQ